MYQAAAHTALSHALTQHLRLLQDMLADLHPFEWCHGLAQSEGF